MGTTNSTHQFPASQVNTNLQSTSIPSHSSKPQHDPLAPPKPGSTELEMIEIPSSEFFPMWQAHMDSLLQHNIQYSADSIWEFVLADCRLQYVELLRLDGAVEVEFVSVDEDDIFLAVPCKNLSREVTWKVNNLGWMKIPIEISQDVHRIPLSNEWWIGLRTSFNSSVRSLMQYKLFLERFLRLFIVPVHSESYMRVIATTNMPQVLQSLLKDTNSVGVRFLAHCLISKPPGEFPATVQDATDGTQQSHETEVYDYLTTEDAESSGAQVRGRRRLIFQRSDSCTASSPTLVQHDSSPEKIQSQVTRDGGVSLEPPSYEAAVAMISFEKEPIHEIPNAQPSAPPLEQLTHKLGPSDSRIPPESSAPPLQISGPALDSTLNASSKSDASSKSSGAQVRGRRRLIFQRSDSCMTSSHTLVQHDSSAEKIQSQVTRDGGVSLEPPSYEAAEPIHEIPNAQPSAPPLEQLTHKLGPSNSRIPPESSAPPLHIPGPALDSTLNASSKSDASSKQASKPLPLLLRQSSLENSGLGLHLYPHQKRTVSWMLDVEAGRTEALFVPQATLFGGWYVFNHGFTESMFHESVDVLVPKFSRLVRGGLLAHPVGSGKTVIAAELIGQTLAQGLTVVFVPGHIAKQWKKELKRFVPGINVSLIRKVFGTKVVEFWWSIKPESHVVIVPHNLAPRMEFGDVYPFRTIIDEPQDIISNSGIFEALLEIDSPCRWLLTATPNPLSKIMQLALGYQENPMHKLPCDSMLSWFSRSRCRRDPPYLCLPVPPLHIHMRPVTLLWQETSVLHSYAMQNDLQAAIRLSSFFYFSQEGIQNKTAAAETLKGAKAFQSLNEWVQVHRSELSAHLEKEERSLQSVEREIAQEKATYAKEKSVAEGQAESLKNQRSENDEVVNLEQVFQEGEEQGVSLRLLRARNLHRENTRNFKRLLSFLSTINETVISDSECLICMNQLGGRVISMLPCLHSFCATCAARLFVSSRRALCPVCRQFAQRREICTFMCVENQPSGCGDLREKYGSKICRVIQEIEQILRDFRKDKILVFGQWHDLLRQMSDALPKKIKHCFLDGPLSQRCEIIEKFCVQPDIRVMLLSSESQSSGANLEVANHVVVIHPYCPPYVKSASMVPLAQAQAFEQQAVGRVLRFPQSKEVHVYRFYSLGTPEEELYTHWGWAGARQTEEACRRMHMK